MNIVPHMDFKRIPSCQPGELVLTAFRKLDLAIVAVEPESNERFLIFLEGEKPFAPPYYMRCQQYAGGVATYGHEYQIEVDVCGPKEIKPDKLFDLSGAILIDGSHKLLRVDPGQGYWGGDTGYLDIEKGLLIKAPNNDGYATFAHWSISVGGQTPGQRITLFSHPRIAESTSTEVAR